MTKDIISKKNQHRWIFVVLLIVATSSSLAFAEDSASSNSDIGSIAGVLWPVFLGWIGAIVLSFRKHKLSVLLSSLCGILLSAYLSWQHISGNDAAACQVGELFNCAKVNTSIYGVLSGHLSFLPSVPLAFLGFSFYASIFFLGITTLSDDENQEKSFSKAGTWLCMLSGLSIVLSGYLAYISKVEIGAWCLYCIGMYGFNVTLFIASIFWMRSQKKEDLIDMSFNTIAVPFAILSVLSVFLSSVKFSEEEVVSQGEWAIEKLEIESILSGKEPIYGSPSAPYSVIEFADYQCPHCARTTPSIKKLITAHAKLINLKYKHYPLSNTCNHNISSKGHALACEAAYAANCAGKQQKFWQLSKLLFINGSYLEDNSFDLLAQQLQLNTADFSACMQNPSTKEEVLQDIKAADIAKIQGTPALFLHDGENWWKIQEHDKGLKKVLLLLAQGETPPHGKTNPFQPQNLDPSNSQPKED